MSSASATIESPVKRSAKPLPRVAKRYSLREVPSWLTSLCVHLSALVVLGLAQVAIHNSDALSFSVSRGAGDPSDGMGDFDLNTSDGGQNGQLLGPGDLPSANEFTKPLDPVDPTQPLLQLAKLGPVADPSNFKLPSIGLPNSN